MKPSLREKCNRRILTVLFAFVAGAGYQSILASPETVIPLFKPSHQHPVSEAERNAALDRLEPYNEPTVRRDDDVAPTAGLYGKVVVTDPAHGRTWRGTYWGWQREDWFAGRHRHSSQEDINTARMVNRWLLPYLRNAGATVYSNRCSDEQVNEVIVDVSSATASSGVTSSGQWRTSAGGNAYGGQYAYAVSTAGSSGDASAQVFATIPESGYYGVTIWYADDLNATYDAQFKVIDAGGNRHSFRVNQSRDSGRWVWLDRFYFDAGTSVPIMEVTNASVTPGKHVVLDCVRLGGGMGTETFGGTPSGLPRWQENSVCWTKYTGAPESVWRASLNGSHDYETRNAYLSWQRGEFHMRVHTNGSTYHTGYGTEIYQQSPTNEAEVRMRRVLPAIINSIRNHYKPTWTNRGVKSNWVGYVSIPDTNLELAFHDYLTDAEALMDADFRKAAMRGYYEGVLDFFTDRTGVYTPEPPAAPSVKNIGGGMVRAEWTTSTMGGIPDAFRIYYSTHPHCYKDYVTVSYPNLSADIGPLEPGKPYYFQWRSVNSGGLSLPSETLAAIVNPNLPGRPILMVNGFDRYDWDVDETNNTRNSCVEHITALADAATSKGVSLVIDAAANEAVAQGRMDLSGYAMVDWILGQEGKYDVTVSLEEQLALSEFKSEAGLLFLSGSDVAYDLASGSTEDLNFLNSSLGAALEGRTVNPQAISPVPGGLFDGIDLSLSPDEPRRLLAADTVQTTGTGTAVYMNSGAGGAMGVYQQGPVSTSVYFTFPFEAITERNNRASIMERMIPLMPDKSLVKDWTIY